MVWGIQIIILDTFFLFVGDFFGHLGVLDFLEYLGESSLLGLCGWRWLLMMVTFKCEKILQCQLQISIFVFHFFVGLPRLKTKMTMEN